MTAIGPLKLEYVGASDDPRDEFLLTCARFRVHRRTVGAQQSIKRSCIGRHAYSSLLQSTGAQPNIFAGTTAAFDHSSDARFYTQVLELRNGVRSGLWSRFCHADLNLKRDIEAGKLPAATHALIPKRKS